MRSHARDRALSDSIADPDVLANLASCAHHLHGSVAVCREIVLSPALDVGMNT
jgi:hypothetical protein